MEEKSILQKIVDRTFSELKGRPEFNAKVIEALQQVANDGELNKPEVVKRAITRED